ncbi:MAG: type 4a pilus biogenesis protein PilO [bacterium]|jgi:Tfp pilus assembly protein PilO
MASLLERRVLLIALAAYVVLAVLAVVFLYQPQLSKRQRNAATVAELQQQLDETRARVKQIGRLRARVEELQAQDVAFRSHVVPRSQMLSTLKDLAQKATYAKVRFLEIQPPGLDTLLEEETQNTPLRSVPFMVTVQGRYIDIGLYVESLNSYPYFLRVPAFEIVSRDDIRPEVEAKLQLNLYASSLASGSKL